MATPQDATGSDRLAQPSTSVPPEGGAIKLQVDDRDLTTQYVNAFRSNATSEEVVIDLGFNTVERYPQPDAPEGTGRDGYARLQISTRAVMNYATAKRLALTLGQIVRRYEDRFGEIQLNRDANAARDGRTRQGV